MPFQGTFRQAFAIEVAGAAFVFLVVIVLLSLALVRRRASTKRPMGKPEHPVLEGSYTALVAVAAGLLVWLSLAGIAHLQSRRTASTRVVVTAFQWCWRFSYPSSGASVTGTCGSRRDYPTLVVPTGRPVEIEVTSSDVVHEFWVPALKYKVEALPDHTNRFVVTITHSGRWVGRCSEFCGLYHTFMDFYFQAMPPASYTRWLAGQHHNAVA